MNKNTEWERPEHWDELDKEGHQIWDNFANKLETFYRDMKKHNLINYGLGSDIPEYEPRAFQNFFKTLEFEDKVYRTANMLFSINVIFYTYRLKLGVQE